MEETPRERLESKAELLMLFEIGYGKNELRQKNYKLKLNISSTTHYHSKELL